MPRESLTTERVLTLLAEGPTRIASLTDGVSTGELHTALSNDEWSVNDVLAHLRACGDVWGNNVMAMLAEEIPTLRGVSPRTWIKKTDYLAQDFQLSFRLYATQRANLLSILKPLPGEDWSRRAMVKAAGQVHERTVLHFAESLALHEQVHVEQIESIIETQRSQIGGSVH
jgi:DinB superfamily